MDVVEHTAGVTGDLTSLLSSDIWLEERRKRDQEHTAGVTSALASCKAKIIKSSDTMNRVIAEKLDDLIS